jgi:hypothetical protein
MPDGRSAQRHSDRRRVAFSLKQRPLVSFPHRSMTTGLLGNRITDADHVGSHFAYRWNSGASHRKVRAAGDTCRRGHGGTARRATIMSLMHGL